MFVCVCSAANDKTIQEAIVTVHGRTGNIPKVKEIFSEVGCGEGNCKHLCGAQIKEMITSADLAAPAPKRA